MKRTVIAFAFGALAIGVILAFSLLQSSTQNGGEPPLAGWMEKFSVADVPQPVPAELAFSDREGREVRLADFHGRVVLLNFWATWCAPCIREMPSLDRLQAELGGEAFTVVALSQDRGGIAEAAPFFDDLGLSHMELYADPTMRSARLVQARGLPTSVLIDREGREIGRLEGEADWDSEEAVALIRHYLGEPGA